MLYELPLSRVTRVSMYSGGTWDNERDRVLVGSTWTFSIIVVPSQKLAMFSILVRDCEQSFTVLDRFLCLDGSSSDVRRPTPRVPFSILVRMPS